MKHVLNHDFAPEFYFEKICEYPHGSYHEKPLSDYLTEFAKEHGLRYRQYENWNVIIYKDASAGYEDHEPLILQGHIDMVCEKDQDCDHDFLKDPLDLYVEDGFLKAKGTTLGADDGVAVAYMLAILADDKIPHPPLECVFTTQEEVGCVGAFGIDFSDLKSKRMLSLDGLGGTTCDVSSAGSWHQILNRKITKENRNSSFYKIKIDGLKGGHSGSMIDKERANSIKLMARILCELNKKEKIRLAHISGGDKDNAIPVYCEALFCSDAEEAELEKIVKKMSDIIHHEYMYSDEDITVSFEKSEKESVLSEGDSNDLIAFLMVLPNGLRHKSMVIDDLTTASQNLASIRMDDEQITIRYFARAQLRSHLEEQAEEIALLAMRFGFLSTLGDYAPSWEYQKDSKIRELLFKVYNEITGKQLTPIATHGGLETGYFCTGIPGIDIATYGPLVLDYHTSREALDLDSFREAYSVVLELLRRA